MWTSYDLSTARSKADFTQPLGHVPADGEHFAVDEFGYVPVRISGVNHPGFAKSGPVNALRVENELRASDIVIMTYPKCGTTWMQQIVFGILANGDTSQLGDDVMDLSPWPEKAASMGQTLGEPVVGDRRVLKTHAPATHVPWKASHGAKQIIVGRNPFDACVSMWHHSRDVEFFKYSGDFDHFCKSIFLTGVAEHGDFWEWYGGHWAAYQAKQAAGNNDTLWITFEDMKADPCASVKRVCEFLGVEPTDELLRKVVGASAFDAMKARIEASNKAKAEKGQWYKKNHMRQGRAGAWKKIFTVEQYETLLAAHKERSATYGLPEDAFECYF
eukprot:Rhum_TRINITY_DN13455_c1_g2::Rhum_TRINITY_DN13455_c1_g2_i1::g.60545::m.60545/K01015/SULT2B1; alcohol sulfotransferase